MRIGGRACSGSLPETGASRNVPELSSARLACVVRTSLALITLALAAALAGCSGDDEVTCASSFGPCDIHDGRCQLDTFTVVACLRDVERGDPPPVRTITQDQYADDLRAAWK